MRVFKQEQIFMVEEYFLLKKSDTAKTIMLAKQDSIILQQERIISEHTCFLHDALDRIFKKALERQP